MQKIFFSEKKYSIIKKNKERLEKALNITLELNKKEIIIKSKKDDSIIEFLAMEILEALVLGFDIDAALQLRDTDFILKKLDLKSYVKDSRLNIVRGRIIGTKGKTKHVIEKLSESELVISDHIVAMIGRIESVEIASHAIQALIRGSPQSKVYSYLEKSRARFKELAEEDVEEMIKK